MIYILSKEESDSKEYPLTGPDFVILSFSACQLASASS